MSDMYQRIKPHFAIIAHSPDSVELRSGVWNRISYTIDDDTHSGKLFQFIQLLNGSRSVYEITQLLQMNRSEAESIIDHLNQLNVLESGYSNALDYYLEMYAPVFKNKQLPYEESINKKIIILATDELAIEIKDRITLNTPFSNAEIISTNSDFMKRLTHSDDSWLHNALQFEEMVENFSCLKNSFIVVAFDYINPVFAKRFNRIATALSITWIHAAIDGPFVFVGPTFQPLDTACYECFETRVSMNLREYPSYQKYKNAIANNQISKQAASPMLPLLRNLMISHLIMEVMNYILTRCNFTKNKTMSIYLPTMEIIFNEFLKVSNCECCGSHTHRDDYQLYFDVQELLRDVV